MNRTALVLVLFAVRSAPYTLGLRVKGCVLGFLLATGMAQSMPSDLILFRHAEKPEDPKELHLSPVGRLRSEALVPFLNRTFGLGSNRAEVVLFATQPTKHGHGARPQETLRPLANHLEVPIRTPYLAEEHAALAQMIKASRAFDRKRVVICWVHEFLPQLLAELGVRPSPGHWKGSDYEQVWWVRFDRDGTASLKTFRQPPLRP